eukprot:11041719-Heterocapsa_arctica.AAC.1
MREAGVQADMEGADWAECSMCRALRLLISTNDMVIRRMLRKIHIRLWHAPTARMKELLLTAGVKQEVLNLIKVIIDTRSTCRAWQSPGFRPVHTSR